MINLQSGLSHRERLIQKRRWKDIVVGSVEMRRGCRTASTRYRVMMLLRGGCMLWAVATGRIQQLGVAIGRSRAVCGKILVPTSENRSLVAETGRDRERERIGRDICGFTNIISNYVIHICTYICMTLSVLSSDTLVVQWLINSKTVVLDSLSHYQFLVTRFLGFLQMYL